MKWKNPLKDRGAPIDAKIKEGHLRLFDHIQKRAINSTTRKEWNDSR